MFRVFLVAPTTTAEVCRSSTLYRTRSGPCSKIQHASRTGMLRSIGRPPNRGSRFAAHAAGRLLVSVSRRVPETRFRYVEPVSCRIGIHTSPSSAPIMRYLLDTGIAQEFIGRNAKVVRARIDRAAAGRIEQHNSRLPRSRIRAHASRGAVFRPGSTSGHSLMRQRHRLRGFPHILSLIILAAGCTCESYGGELKVDGRTIRVPARFTIDRIAGPPLINRPITAAFDDEGRLYVADSSGSNDNVKKQLAERPHRIVRLEDRDGDGVFDNQTVFADKMMFPEGTMWLDGSLYVAAPPSIWKLTDTNGDGVADSRVEWFQGKTLTGCANDLHGPYPGPDGWIYWCKGAFAQQTYAGPGAPFTTRAAHIFRSRRDGTGIEPVMTGGMDNPVDVVFTPGGERIFTTTFFVHPGGGQRDGLIHAIFGGIYGKVHDPIFEPAHRWTGPEVMPVLLHMGPAAPCGLTRYESDALGNEYKDSLFACYFNLHKVSRHVLKPQGATFTTQDQDFVTSPDLDFHPTDVIEDAAGSLIVVDTGGWYKLCCPTSQLQKPDVLGAIYRVRRDASRPVADPCGRALRDRENGLSSAAKVKDFVPFLGDSRPAVRRKAIEILSAPQRRELVLTALGDVALTALSPELRRNIVWTLARIDHASAREQVRGLLRDADETVVQAAIHTAGLWRDSWPSPD